MEEALPKDKEKQEEEEEVEEVVRLEEEVRAMATQVEKYREEGPAVFVAQLQRSLQQMRPPLPLPQQDPPPGCEEDIIDEDNDGGGPIIAQISMLKAKIAGLNANVPALVQRMKKCMEELDRRKAAASATKYTHLAFR